MKANYTIDWLRYTAFMPGDGSRMVPEHQIFEFQEPSKAYPFYEFASSMGAGRVDWCADGIKMPHMATFAGQDMQKVRDAGAEDALLRHVVGLHSLNVTRLDFAIDVFDGFTVDEFQARWDAGQIKSKARTTTTIERKTGAKSGGKTVYIGSRQSSKMLRVYDKGKQLRLADKWVRVEIELKQDVATKVLKQMVVGGIREVGCAVLRQFASAPNWLEWTQLTEGATEVDTAVGRKATNREKWLKNVVFPNFERALSEGDADAWLILAYWAERLTK